MGRILLIFLPDQPRMSSGNLIQIRFPSPAFGLITRSTAYRELVHKLSLASRVRGPCFVK